MGVLESARGVLWARRRRPEQVTYAAALGHERFGPDELLRQAVAAEEAGFDAICCSDHLAPWWPPGEPAPAHCANAWVWLGAAGHATSQISLGSSVTGLVHRYNPVVVAQQVATLEALYPGRAFLGVGTSEAMNEVPAGFDWPSPAEQPARVEEALTIITRVLDGPTVAFGEQAAEIAGRLADGVWTLADPQKAPPVIAAYRRGAEGAGREPGEIILQGMVSWAESDETALEGAREWKPTLVAEHYTDPVYDPAEIQANGREVSDTTFKMMGLISSDPDQHVRKIKAMQQLGATAIVLMNISGNDPEGTLRTYGERVLPQLRGG